MSPLVAVEFCASSLFEPSSLKPPMTSSLPDILASSEVLISMEQNVEHVVVELSPSTILPAVDSLLAWEIMILPVPLAREADPVNDKSSPVKNMSPPLEARLPKFKAPVAVKIISPPLVEMVSLELAKVIVPFVTVKVTEFPLPCCKLSVSPPRSFKVILFVARSSILVVLEMASSSVS